MRRFVRENGKGRWCYRLDREHWEKVQAILQRRAERRERLENVDVSGDPPLGLTPPIHGGDQSQNQATMASSTEAKPLSINEPSLEEMDEWEWEIENSA